MCKIECKLSDLLESEQEFNRKMYNTFVDDNPRNSKLCNTIRTIDTDELIFLDLADYFDQKGHFSISTKTGKLFAVYVSIPDSPVRYDENNEEFYIKYDVKMLFVKDSDKNTVINSGEIKVSKKSFVEILLVCAYIDKKMNIIEHPEIQTAFQGIIDSTLDSLKKNGECQDHKIIACEENIAQHRDGLKLVFVDESSIDVPIVLGTSLNFGIGIDAVDGMKVWVKTLRLSLDNSVRDMAIYIVNEKNNELFFGLPQIKRPKWKEESLLAIISIDDNSIFIDEDIKNYFNDRVKPKIEEFQSLPEAKRITSSFMDDLFW